MEKHTILIGLGNALMSDEGIGVRILQELVHRGEVPPQVEPLDLGPGGLSVLHACTGYARAIFIDCGFMGRPTGTLVAFHPEDVQTIKIRPRQSLHEGDLLETLELARRLGQCPPDVTIFAVQPSRVSLGDHLSPELESRLDFYVTTIAHSLRWAKRDSPFSPNLQGEG